MTTIKNRIEQKRRDVPLFKNIDPFLVKFSLTAILPLKIIGVPYTILESILKTRAIFSVELTMFLRSNKFCLLFNLREDKFISI